jgi:hypothetical protein
MPSVGSGLVVLPWSSPRGQHHAAVALKVHLTNLFRFPEPPLYDYFFFSISIFFYGLKIRSKII